MKIKQIVIETFQSVNKCKCLKKWLREHGERKKINYLATNKKSQNQKKNNRDNKDLKFLKDWKRQKTKIKKRFQCWCGPRTPWLGLVMNKWHKNYKFYVKVKATDWMYNSKNKSEYAEYVLCVTLAVSKKTKTKNFTWGIIFVNATIILVERRKLKGIWQFLCKQLLLLHLPFKKYWQKNSFYIGGSHRIRKKNKIAEQERLVRRP